ncbi:MAG: hypothetical protein KTR27_11710 [Leptolyngbyaceae cyanobacterium MAG.088]|nr:hypothetical protein [Leptolyngbyaceae cyanobacterium MAG.088]
MVNIHQLLNHLIDTEQELCESDFLAPCVRQGCLRARMNGRVYTFNLKGWPFEGWGVFRPATFETATLVMAANSPQVEQYLTSLPAFRLRLVYRLQNRSWLAYPSNEADARRRLGQVKPLVVHLVSDGVAFDQIIARWDGNAFWFEQLDRQANVEIAPYLRQSLTDGIWPDQLCTKGLTLETRTAYSLAIQQIPDFATEKQDEHRLHKVLKTGGGHWQHFQNQADVWTVHWTTADGEYHTNDIAKNDLTVMSAGICLSDRDRNVDLPSLVNVMT